MEYRSLEDPTLHDLKFEHAILLEKKYVNFWYHNYNFLPYILRDMGYFARKYHFWALPIWLFHQRTLRLRITEVNRVSKDAEFLAPYDRYLGSCLDPKFGGDICVLPFKYLDLAIICGGNPDAALLYMVSAKSCPGLRVHPRPLEDAKFYSGFNGNIRWSRKQPGMGLKSKKPKFGPNTTTKTDII